jgi:DNA modification methylase
VFREVRRVLVKDGTLWIVIADSYAGSGKGRDADGNHRVDKSKSGSYRGQTDGRIAKQITGCKPKDLLGIPWSLAFALRDDGWYLRSNIIWHKPNSMPHSVTDRPVNTYEHIFLLAKSSRYYFDYHALEVPTGEESRRRVKRGFNLNANKYTDGAPGQTPQTINRAIAPNADPPSMRRGRDVWSCPTAPYRGSHFAVFPLELVKPCIMAGCPEGGVVLDPFMGSGTTGAAALSLNRRYLGIELNPEYIPLAEARLREITKQIDGEERDCDGAGRDIQDKKDGGAGD